METLEKEFVKIEKSLLWYLYIVNSVLVSSLWIAYTADAPYMYFLAGSCAIIDAVSPDLFKIFQT